MLRLKEIRKECGLKRSKLAADLKINAGTLANYENGIRQAPYETLIRLADYFDVSVDYLLGKSDDGTPITSSPLTADEMGLLSDFRKLGKIGKMRVIEYAQLWREKTDDPKNS